MNETEAIEQLRKQAQGRPCFECAEYFIPEGKLPPDGPDRCRADKNKGALGEPLLSFPIYCKDFKPMPEAE